MPKCRNARLFILLIVTLLAAPAFGQEKRPPETTPDLERVLEPVVAKALDDAGTPGAVVVVVRSGRVVLAHGYGYADFGKKTPVDHAGTLFYLGSVTKTFTATAVMQLVEQGKLDLHADVNRYITAFQVPQDYPLPVTLHHLLTHTAGFDDKNIGYVARTENEAQTLQQYLSTQLPPRVAAPGERTAYSNHGFGLAGLIVERAAGLPYSDYIEQKIMRPLGMNRSTAHVPPSAELLRDLAPGHTWDGARQKPVAPPLGYRNVPPAGSVSSTGLDMARYMLMHLQLGRSVNGADQRVLSEESARTMQRQQFTHHPELTGIAYAFYERRRGAQRLLQHDGMYLGYAASMVLAPESETGIFVATNGGSLAVPTAVSAAVLDYLFPGAVETRPPLAPPSHEYLARYQDLTGSYALTRFSRTSVERVAVWDNQVRVTSSPDGTLEVQPRNRPAQRYFEVAPLVFENQRGERLAFRVEPDGLIGYFFMSLTGLHFPGAFERLTWRDDLRFQIPAFIGTAAILATTFTLWPLWAGIAAVVRHLRKKPRKTQPLPRTSVALAAMAGLLAVAIMAGLDAMLGNSAYRNQLVYGMTLGMRVLLWLPIAFAGLAVALVFFAVRQWRHAAASLVARLYFSLVTVAALLFLALLWNLNLLRFNY